MPHAVRFHRSTTSAFHLLRLAAFTVAALLPAAVSAETREAQRTYASLAPLPPGEIKPEGWLGIYLKKQADGLGGNLINVSWPFTDPYWAGQEGGKTWWPWEQQAYWIDGAMRLALATGNAELYAKVKTYTDYILDHQGPDGYLGPKTLAPPDVDFSRWPHAVVLRSLMALADSDSPLVTSADRKRIVDAIEKHFLSGKVPYGTSKRNVINVEAMLWCYARTGNPELLALAERSWQEYMTKARDRQFGDLGTIRVMQNMPIDSHGVTYAETSKQPAILYMYTGKKEYLDYALAAQRRVLDHHMLISGIPSSSEWYRSVTALDSHETCDIADHAWTWDYMLQATGDASWADLIEKACLNAGMGAIKKDWKGVQYFSSPNQFLATKNSNHNSMKLGNNWMAYQPNPGEKTACCGGNIHRVFPNYALNMWMRRNNGLAAIFYGASTLRAVVGPKGQPIEIAQSTNYPFDEQIHFKIAASQPVTFPLSLRIPNWCENPQLTVNNSPIKLPEKKNGFITIERTFEPGDLVSLALPMKIAVSHWPQNGVGFEYGPLVFAYPIKEQWSSYISEKYSTSDFPGWEAKPASPWNFAAILDMAKPDYGVVVKKSKVAEGQDPWQQPPVALLLPGRKIDDWKLMPNPENPSQLFTPPLPDLKNSKVNSVAEDLTLAPYGSTHLRLTIFPNLKDQN